jgi:hypothetical protein
MFLVQAARILQAESGICDCEATQVGHACSLKDGELRCVSSRWVVVVRQLPKKILAAASVAGAAFFALLVVTLLTGSWADFFVGSISVVAILLLLAAIRGQRDQRAAAKALSERLDLVAAQVGGIVSRPAMLSGSQEQLIAEMASRFDWIARRQAELMRLLKDHDLTHVDGAATAPDQASAVDP